jgi:hypothetical protein
MDIQFEKIELIKKLLETNDESVIESIKSIFKKEKNDFWDELSIAEKNAIEEGLEDVKNGNVTSWDNFINEYI